MKAIREMGLVTMTAVQAECIPVIYKGHDLFARSHTGSGKTLAFLIPVVDMVHQIGFKTRNGTGAMIICPTNELAVQTFSVLKQLTKYHNHTIALITGGGNRGDEARRLFNGVNIIVATPMRLLDHLENTKDFLFRNLELMVVDEADCIFENGFEDTIKEIISITPSRKQLLFFTATTSEKTYKLAIRYLTKEPMLTDVIDERATCEGLDEGYIVCPPEKRFSALISVLRENRDCKILVFMGAGVTVDFYWKIARQLIADEIEIIRVHGGMEQRVRQMTFRKFAKMKTGVLFCTDVAGRGIDFKDIDLVIQFDPPASVQEYIHKVGRTARGEGAEGTAMIFLMEHELDFVKKLREAKTIVRDFEINWKPVPDLTQLAHEYAEDKYIRNQATEAYEGFVRSYKNNTLKDIFDFDKIDLNKLALSFCLKKAPWINYSLKRKAEDDRGFGQKRRKAGNFREKFDHMSKYNGQLC